MTEPRSLFYYDRSPAAWLERTAGLSPLARAAYADLEGAAWTAPKRGAPPCSVPDDDAQLARMARMDLRDFKKVAAEVRALFMYRDGALVDDVLLKTWQDAQGRYTRRVVAGGKGNEAQGKGTHSVRNATRNANALHTQLELESEGVVPPVPSGPGGNVPPAGDGALAPEGAPAAPATGDYLDRPSVQEELLRRGVRPGGATPPADPDGFEARSAEHERAYFAALTAAADQYAAERPASYAVIRREEAHLFGFRGALEALPETKQDTLRYAVMERLRALEHWPRSAEWDGTTPLRALSGAPP